MKIFLFYSLLALVSFNLIAQSPVISTYAYSRKTISGIREEGNPNKNPFPASYYIYVTVPKGTKVSISGVWIEGKYFSANMQKVKSPVFMNDNGVNIDRKHKEVMVKKTPNDVYAIQLGKEQPWNNQDALAKQLTQNNQVVIFLSCNTSPCYSSSKTIKALTPHSAM